MLVLGGKRVWQIHVAISLSEVCLMQTLHFGEMALEGILDAPRQHCHAILLCLATAYHDVMIGKIDIFHTQAETLHQAESSAIEQTCHQRMHPRKLCQHHGDLPTGKNCGQATWAFGAFKRTEFWQFLLQHVAIQEE